MSDIDLRLLERYVREISEAAEECEANARRIKTNAENKDQVEMYASRVRRSAQAMEEAINRIKRLIRQAKS